MKTAIPIFLKVAPIAILLFSIVGFADATYLTNRHYEGLASGCATIGGCETVTASKYATVGNIPVALVGAVYYFAILALVISYFILERKASAGSANFVLTLAARLTILGFLASLWFVYLQLFVIKAICPYCMVSAATSTMLFIFGMVLLRMRQSLAGDTEKAVA